MTRERKAEFLCIICWFLVVILPTGGVCLYFHIKDVRLVAVALPFILIAERVYRKWLQKAGLWKQENSDAVTRKSNESEPTSAGDVAARAAPEK